MQSISRYLFISLVCLGCLGSVFLFTDKSPSHSYQQEKQESPSRPRLAEETTGPVNVSLPEISLTDLSGKTISLNAYAGKPTLIVFWTTWCQPCKQEMAFLKTHASSLKKDDHITVVGVNMLTSELSKSDVSHFIQGKKIKFPILLDRDDQLTTALDVHTIPTSYLFNKKGKLVAKNEGPLETATLDKLINKLKTF